jgi:hypothetical protein
MVRSKHISILILILVVALIIVERIITPFNGSLSWDVFGYYLYLPATFIYHDPGLTNHGWINIIMQQYHNTDFFYQAYPGIEHYWVIKYPMGLALLYSPFFFIAHGLAGFLGYARDGFTMPYQFALSFGMLFYTFTGIYFIKKILNKFFDGIIPAVIILLIVLGTNYFHLTADAGMMPHNILFMLVAMFIWFTLKWKEELKVRYAVYLGVLTGLILISRPNEIVCLLFLMIWIGMSFRSLKAKWFHILYAIAAFILIVIPQIIYWKFTSGHFIFYSYQDPCQGFDFDEPYLIGFLFSFRKGWFVYTPMVVVMLSGAIVLYKKNRKLFFAAMAYILAGVYIAASWSCWWYAGCCYSQRAVMSLYVVLALPLGYLLQWMTASRWFIKWPLIDLMGLLVMLNLFQMWQFNHGIIDSERMTCAYYGKIFTKTGNVSEYRGMLSPEARIDEDTVKKNFANLPKTTYGFKEFSSAGNFKVKKYVQNNSISGVPYYVMNSNDEFSPAIDISYKILGTDLHWVKVGVDLYFPAQNITNCPLLIISTVHKGDNCKYYTRRIARDSVRFGTWMHMQRLYLTPEVRSRKDNLSVYLWNPDHAEFYIRDLKAEVYDY